MVKLSAFAYIGKTIKQQIDSIASVAGVVY